MARAHMQMSSYNGGQVSELRLQLTAARVSARRNLKGVQRAMKSWKVRDAKKSII